MAVAQISQSDFFSAEGNETISSFNVYMEDGWITGYIRFEGTNKVTSGPNALCIFSGYAVKETYRSMTNAPASGFGGYEISGTTVYKPGAGYINASDGGLRLVMTEANRTYSVVGFHFSYPVM